MGHAPEDNDPDTLDIEMVVDRQGAAVATLFCLLVGGHLCRSIEQLFAETDRVIFNSFVVFEHGAFDERRNLVR